MNTFFLILVCVLQSVVCVCGRFYVKEQELQRADLCCVVDRSGLLSSMKDLGHYVLWNFKILQLQELILINDTVTR